MALLVFADETGSNNLGSIDPRAPNFALCMILCDEDRYTNHTHPRVQRFKREHCLHSKVALHSYEIRHKENDFSFLETKEQWLAFCEGLILMMREADYHILISIIKMHEHIAQYVYPEDPYELSLKFLMERLCIYMEEMGHVEAKIIFEARGGKHDKRLRKVMDALIANGTAYITADRFAKLKFQIWFEGKKKNIAGLEIADLAAFPIMLHHAVSPHPSYPVLKPKIYREKIFPPGTKAKREAVMPPARAAGVSPLAK